AVVGRFDIDSSDVVGQQYQLIGVDLMLVLVWQLLVVDQSGLDQPSNKSARASKGVDNMHSLATKGLAKLPLQQVVNAVEDEVHHLDRGVDDTQALSHFRKGVTEELVV